MSEHKGQTDQEHEVKLDSTIELVAWRRRIAAAGGKVMLEVRTHYVGLGADLEIKLTDYSGKSFGTFEDQIYSGLFESEVLVPLEAREALYAEVKLPKHGLSMASRALFVIPPVKITNAAWSASEAVRGDLLTLSANVEGAPDGLEAEVTIWEFDPDGAHVLVTKIPAFVQKKKVELKWEFQYHSDTDKIPTAEESENGYQQPEYFFRVTIGGVSADSGNLKFTDWIELVLKDETGNPIGDVDYKLVLPDGNEQEGKLDANGHARIDKVPPGRYKLSFPDIAEHLPPPPPEPSETELISGL